ncbi:hypothetical protein JW710_01860 [Candidatus Dojkabacteria bacterium]|nr:hypothetical protein [Candidatus Dojkabacteria bacterium]
MSLINPKNEVRIFVDEDFTANDVKEELVGRKGYSLFRLRDMDVPVPSFMCISSGLFSEYIASSLGSLTSSASISEINKKILEGNFPDPLKEEIQRGYSRLSGFTDSWVAVRSSIVPPINQKELAFSGLLDTVLNVKGVDDLLAAIKKVYASAFTERVASYLRATNSSIAEIKVSIVVQKMIQAEASGIVFTIDPISQNSEYLTVESVFGLGDVIAAGELTPDQYIINKKTLDFKEKRIVPQEWMMVRKVKHKDGEGATQKVRISKAWQHQQKLDNRYLEELAKISMTIEQKASGPQDIEWVFEGGRLWILQTQDVKPVSIEKTEPDPTLKIDKDIIDSAKAIAEREQSKKKIMEELAKEREEHPSKETIKPKENHKNEEEVFAAKPFNRQVVQAPRKEKSKVERREIQNIPPHKGERLVLTGIGASNGSYRGEAVIIQNADEIKENEPRLKKDFVLVFPDFFPELEKYITKAGAIVSDQGGITSDIAIRCREQGIPCIMGSHIASHMIKQGEPILIDGNVGAVYGVREVAPPSKSEDLPQSQNEKPQDIEIKAEPAEVKAQEQEPEPVTAKIRTATKVFIDLSDSYLKGEKWEEMIPESDGVATIQVEDIYKKFKRHPEAYIEEGKSKELIDNIANELSAVCERSEGNTVIATIGSMTVDEYQKLVKGSSYEKWTDESGIKDHSAGLPRLLQRPKELDLFFKAIRTVRNKHGWRNISIGVNFPTTTKNFIEFKKLLSAAKLRRSSTFKVFHVIDTPSEAMTSEEFVEIGIDGAVINVNSLAKLMMAPALDDESVLKIIDKISQSWRGSTVIIQTSKDSEKLIERAVRVGSYGLAVQPNELTEARLSVSQTEAKIALS